MEAELRRRRRRVGDEGATFMCPRLVVGSALRRGTAARRWSQRSAIGPRSVGSAGVPGVHHVADVEMVNRSVGRGRR